MATTVAYFCSKCQAPTPTPKRCGKCKTRVYCSANCQKEDWNAHKQMCQPANTEARAHMYSSLEMVNKDTTLIHTLSYFLYAIKQNVDGPKMRCLVLVIINKPWLEMHPTNNYCPIVYCVVREMDRQTFIDEVTRNMHDTGHSELLDQPHRIPRLVIRSVKAVPITGDKKVVYTCQETSNIYPWTHKTGVIAKTGSSVMCTTSHSLRLKGDAPITKDSVPAAEEDFYAFGMDSLRLLTSKSRRSVEEFINGKIIVGFIMNPGTQLCDGALDVLACLPHLYDVANPGLAVGSVTNFYF